MNVDFKGYLSTPEIIIRKFKETWPEKDITKLRFLHGGYSFHDISYTFFTYDFNVCLGLETCESWTARENDHVKWFEGHHEAIGTCGWCKKEWQEQVLGKLEQDDSSISLLEQAIRAKRTRNHEEIKNIIVKLQSKFYTNINKEMAAFVLTELLTKS